jgi:hypothetical protein
LIVVVGDQRRPKGNDVFELYLLRHVWRMLRETLGPLDTTTQRTLLNFGLPELYLTCPLSLASICPSLTSHAIIPTYDT